MKRLILLSIIILLSACSFNIGSPAQLPDAPAPTAIPLLKTAEPRLERGGDAPEKPIALPPGFEISVYVDGLQAPRMMVVGPDGAVYVAERGAGRILRLVDGELLSWHGSRTPRGIDYAESVIEHIRLEN